MYQNRLNDYVMSITLCMSNAGLIVRRAVRRPRFLTYREMRSVFKIVFLVSVENFWLENHRVKWRQTLDIYQLKFDS